MAALMTTQQQVQGLGTLQQLIDLVKDPKLISDAHALARKEQSLTDEQALKAAEAKDFIGKSAQLQKDLEAARIKLVADKTAHEKEKADAELIFENESRKLANAAKEQAATTKANAEAAKRHLDEKRDLEVYKRKLDTEHAERIRQVIIREEAAEKDRNLNAAEANRLAIYEQKLKAKLAKFQEAAAI